MNMTRWPQRIHTSHCQHHFLSLHSSCQQNPSSQYILIWKWKSPLSCRWAESSMSPRRGSLDELLICDEEGTISLFSFERRSLSDELFAPMGWWAWIMFGASSLAPTSPASFMSPGPLESSPSLPYRLMLSASIMFLSSLRRWHRGSSSQALTREPRKERAKMARKATLIRSI